MKQGTYAKKPVRENDDHIILGRTRSYPFFSLSSVGEQEAKGWSGLLLLRIFFIVSSFMEDNISYNRDSRVVFKKRTSVLHNTKDRHIELVR